MQTPTPAHRFSSRSTYASNEPDTSLRVGWKIGQSKCRRATIGRCGVCVATVELATSSAQIKTSGKRKRLEAFVLRWHDLINRSPSKNTSAAWLRISARLSLRPVQRVGLQGSCAPKFQIFDLGVLHKVNQNPLSKSTVQWQQFLPCQICCKLLGRRLSQYANVFL